VVFLRVNLLALASSEDAKIAHDQSPRLALAPVTPALVKRHQRFRTTERSRTRAGHDDDPAARPSGARGAGSRIAPEALLAPLTARIPKLIEQPDEEEKISMKMARRVLVFLVVVLAGAGANLAAAQPVVNTPPAMAANTNVAGFGTAGCGLGSMLFGKQPGMIQVLAATTNGSFGTQTFGITSGTSNCTDMSSGPGSAKAFIETNREALAKDIARGQGETISSLSSLAGCQNSKRVESSCSPISTRSSRMLR